MIEELKVAEDRFKNLALNMKLDFLDHRILLKDPDSLTAQDIADAKRSKDKQRTEIVDLISHIRIGMDCPSQTIRLLASFVCSLYINNIPVTPSCHLQLGPLLL